MLITLQRVRNRSHFTWEAGALSGTTEVIHEPDVFGAPGQRWNWEGQAWTACYAGTSIRLNGPEDIVGIGKPGWWSLMGSFKWRVTVRGEERHVEWLRKSFRRAILIENANVIAEATRRWSDDSWHIKTNASTPSDEPLVFALFLASVGDCSTGSTGG